MNFFTSMILASLLTISMSGCGFVEDKKNAAPAPTSAPERKLEEQKPEDDQDSDGDKVPDQQERLLGRRPFMADLPEVRVRFLQDYLIEAKFKSVSDGSVASFKIDTKVGRNDPNFKYRIGDIFIRDKAYNAAANVGKFSTHSFGEIVERDYFWIKWPEIDPQFYAKEILDNQKYFDETKYEYAGATIKLENSIQLLANRGFEMIKNPTLNFYYYDQERESYELLASKVVERNFAAGVNETVAVTIENVPLALLSENFFKRGEFIVSEVADYEIPSMETTYQELLASIKEKSVPVNYNTPLESRVWYVGVNGESKRLDQVLGVLFERNFTIENDQIKKIDQFESNLPSFTYLKEIASLDKKGKWFLFTDKINRHYLDYEYGASDVIALSYITGAELAAQSSEKVVGLQENISGGEDYKLFSLGNISPNAKIDIQIAPERKWGDKFVEEERNYRERPCSCGKNCICGVLTVDCYVKVNHGSSYDNSFSFNKDFSGELSQIMLIINKSEFALSDLVAQKKLSANWVGNNLHLKIDDPTKILEMANFEENVLFLKLKNFKGQTFQGAYLHNATGKDKTICPGMVARACLNWEEKGVFAGSVMMDGFRPFVSRGLKLFPARDYAQAFSVSVSSVINNMYN